MGPASSDEWRTCRKCERALPLTSFGVYEAKRGTSRCKECCRRVTAEWRASNPEWSRRNSKEWRVKNLERALQRDRDYHAKNAERRRAQSRAWHLANPIVSAAGQRRARFRKCGVKVDDLDRFIPPADHACDVCGTEVPGGKGGWHLDHDHDTKTLRGWLCHRCNISLGGLKDSPTVLAAAIRYLHAHGKALSTDDLASLLHLNTS